METVIVAVTQPIAMIEMLTVSGTVTHFLKYVTRKVLSFLKHAITQLSQQETTQHFYHLVLLTECSSTLTHCVKW